MKFIFILFVIYYISIVNCRDDDKTTYTTDPASFQLYNYGKSHQEYSDLTTNNGMPVTYSDTDTLNSNLLRATYAMDTLSHLVQEKTPPRLVHAKGSGAFGYFTVTHDVSKYIRADIFKKVGAKTRVAVRFSTTIEDQGSADTIRQTRGFAVKMYTKQGNWDILCLNTPVYFWRDPQFFVGFVHSQKKNPVSAVKDPSATWDFFLNKPETINEILHVYSDIGIPQSFRFMNGHAIHAFQVQNKTGDLHLVKFHFVTNLGLKNYTDAEANIIRGQDPDQAVRDLYNAIALKEYPSWTMYIDVMKWEQAQNPDFNPFDVTIEWPADRYITLPVGKLLLNENPTNAYVQMEQIAFRPANLIPGILAPPDKLFQGRILAYLMTQNHRLGVNQYKIPVNCPLHSSSYNRDGVSPAGYNGGDSPSYYPNSFNGDEPFDDFVSNGPTPLVEVHQSNEPNYTYAATFYNGLGNEEQLRLASNIGMDLSLTLPSVMNRALDFLDNVDSKLGKDIRSAIQNIQNKSLSRSSAQAYTYREYI